MPVGRRSITPRLSSRLPRRTVRMRLTLLYGALFVLSGAALLAITYGLVVHTSANFVFKGQDFVVSVPVSAGETPGPGREILGGPGPASPEEARAQEAQLQQLQRRAREQRDFQLHQLISQSAIALAIMVVISIVLGWIVAGRVLRKLRTITRTVRDISANNLHRRLAFSGPDDELKELGDTFDELLNRLEASFRSQRRFIANASHELRTPLTRQRTLIQVATSDPDATAASLRTAHERVLMANRQHEQLIEALLTLARSDAGLERRVHLDLADIADRVLLGYHPEADRRGLGLVTTLDPAPASGDPHLVERLITNLVDNALRYNVPAGHIEVGTGSSAGEAVVWVINTGPVVAASEIDRLLQPFQRHSASRTSHDGGTGLGLSIVQAIVTAHHASLEVAARPDGGLHITATFRDPSPRER